MYPGQSKAPNLHTVWDRWLVRDFMGGRRVADMAECASRTITPEQRKQWEQGGPADRANEAHQVAVEVVYRDVALRARAKREAMASLERQRFELRRRVCSEPWFTLCWELGHEYAPDIICPLSEP